MERLKAGMTERVPLVGDVHVEYPYAGDDRCVLCPSPLSRYNPHVLCFVCQDRVRMEAWRSNDRALYDLLNRRRERNRRCPRITNARINLALLQQAGTNNVRTRGHHPQHGQS